MWQLDGLRTKEQFTRQSEQFRSESLAGPSTSGRFLFGSNLTSKPTITVNLGTSEPEALEGFLWYLAGLMAADILAEDRDSTEGAKVHEKDEVHEQAQID